MPQSIEIKSKTKISSIVILIVGGIGTCTVAFYLLSISLESEYPQVAGLVLGLIFGIFGVYCFIAIWQLDAFQFDGEKLLVKSIFNIPKKTIYVKDIRSYNEIEKENKYFKWKDLTIFTDRHKQKISSSGISNYSELKTALTHGLSRDLNSEREWSNKNNRRFGIGFIVIGLVFVLVMLKVHSNRYAEITTNELSTITGTVAEPLKIDRKKSSRWVHVKLKEYPQFIFKLAGIRFRASHSNALVYEISAEDKIEIDILTGTYEKKISKAKELTFSDKTVNYNFITINGLRKGEKVYLALNRINEEHESDSTGFGFWTFFLVGIGIMGSGIYQFYLGAKPAHNTSHQNRGSK